ncbi:MAG: Rpn family recombination-promoting nuclease/putative transposase, partial [Deltaproteobacteria bacterium]|nr:Rpn family recombination-promoting nuclease/putative transposase [Deltaproteobacteria bacterium]
MSDQKQIENIHFISKFSHHNHDTLLRNLTANYMPSFLDFLDLTEQFADKNNNKITLTGKVDTSFSLINAHTIYLDRLFSLSDGSLLIFEIDSTSKRENYFRYINYAWEVAQYYAKKSNYHSYPEIRLFILHTGQEKYPTFPNCPTTGLVPFIPEVKWMKELDYCGDDV